MSQPPHHPYPGPSDPDDGRRRPDAPSSAPPQPSDPAQSDFTPQPHHPQWGATGPGGVQPAYPPPSFPQGITPQSGPPQAGYPSSAPPAPGYPPPAYPHASYTQPRPSQPSYPQPGYPQPGYPQPAQGQPAYAAPTPGYAQPGYPQSAPPMQGYPQLPKTRSKAVPITLVSVALVLVLCVGGGTAVYLAGRNTADTIANTIATTPPTPATPTSAPPTITVVEPRSLGGRAKLTNNKTVTRSVDQLKRTLALLPGNTNTVAAAYGKVERQDLVLMAAATSRIFSPKAEVDNAFDASSTASLKLTAVSSIPAGPLGGVAKCAKGVSGGSPIALCAWADEGSSGWMIWYFAGLSAAKDEFVKLRGQIEKKSG